MKESGVDPSKKDSDDELLAEIDSDEEEKIGAKMS